MLKSGPCHSLKPFLKVPNFASKILPTFLCYSFSIFATFCPLLGLAQNQNGQNFENGPITAAAPESADKGQKQFSPAELLEKQNRHFQALESLARSISILEAVYVDEKATDSEILVEKALKGITSQLDPHTSYLPAARLSDLSQDTSGKFGGIGIGLAPSNTKFEIVEIMPSSPAQKVGLKVGDEIIAVGGVKITPANAESLLGQLRGLPGTTVKLEVLLAADPSTVAQAKASKIPLVRKSKVFTITRELFRTSSVNHALLAQGYAYIKLSVFQEDSADQLHKAMLFYESQNGGKLDGLILDLRNNPGGLLDQAVRVADFFIDSGIIVSTVGRDPKKQEVEYATQRSSHAYMPLVVLVNEGSASASEIVAGALQDHNRALIMGTQTFGKGSVQSIIPLPNGGGLKVTVARYYTPKGRSIQAKGITPDIPVAASLSAGQNPVAPSRKEADLEGHIEANDLDVGANNAFKQESEKWNKDLQGDNQVRVAYTYLRSWSRFSPSNQIIPKTAAAPTSQPTPSK